MPRFSTRDTARGRSVDLSEKRRGRRRRKRPLSVLVIPLRPWDDWLWNSLKKKEWITYQQTNEWLTDTAFYTNVWMYLKKGVIFGFSSRCSTKKTSRLIYFQQTSLFRILEALWAPTRVKSSFGSTEDLPCWSYEKKNIRFGFSMSKTQILTPMLIYFRPLSFFRILEALWAPTCVKVSFGSTEHLPCWSYVEKNIRFGFSMYKTQILTPMLIYFRPLSFFTPRGAVTGHRGGESAGSPPGLLNIPTNCILTKDGTFFRIWSLPLIFVAKPPH